MSRQHMASVGVRVALYGFSLIIRFVTVGDVALAFDGVHFSSCRRAIPCGNPFTVDSLDIGVWSFCWGRVDSVLASHRLGSPSANID